MWVNVATNMATTIVPMWIRLAFVAAVFTIGALLGSLHGERVAGERHLAYVEQQEVASAKIAQAQTRVMLRTEVRYRDRIRTILDTGRISEKELLNHVTQADNLRCTLNAGFVRSYNAAWSDQSTGSATVSDREPAAVSLTELGQADVANAAVCLAWREQALGWREFYQQLKLVTRTGADKNTQTISP